MRKNKIICKTFISLLLMTALLFTELSSNLKTIILYAEELSDNTSTEEIIKPEKYSYGDFNHDGSLNVFDLMHCRQFLLNNIEQPLDIADMDGNGAFNFHDDSVLKGYLLLKDDEYSRKISSSVSNPDLKDSEKYNYVLFAGSKEADALTVIANTVTNNNIVAANSECNIFAKKSGSGSFVDDAGISIVRMNNKITEKFFCDAVEYSEIDTSEANISLDRPVYSYDGIYIENIDDLPTALINNVCMMAINDIDIDCDSDNELNATLYSKYGNVRIDCNNININGLIYAPYGSVELTANNININGAIIAKKVYINGTDQVNLNCDINISEFIGIDSESMIIPYEDWDYIPRRNDSFFPDIVEEQILEDPLSVDDEWLYDYYGEEVTDEYAESKEDLVNYLYMSQNEDIGNYSDVIDLLQASVENGFEDQVVLKSSNNKNSNSTIEIYGYKINIEKGGAIYDEPIGPPNCYDFVLTVDDDKNTSDDDDTKHPLLKKIDSTKKYVIQDLKQFGLLLATAVGGLTIFAVEKIGELFTLRLSELLFEKGVSCVDDLRKLAQEAFENTIGRIADIDLFDFKKVSLADGVGFEIGSFSLEVNYNDGAINSVTTYKGKTKETTLVDFNKVYDIIDSDLLDSIKESSEELYGDLVNSINSDSVSEIKEIVSEIKNEPRYYVKAYERTGDLKTAYISVKDFNIRYESYEKAVYSVSDNGNSIGENLVNCGAKKPPYSYAAHHIVAKNEKVAQPAVEILKRYGIDIDSAANGVFLPYGSLKDNDFSRVIFEANHFGGHSNAYMLYVNNALENEEVKIVEKNLSKKEGQKMICKKLDEIRKQLLKGTLKIQNQETI